MSTPFAPIAGSTVSINVSASSQSVKLNKHGQTRIANQGSAWVWIAAGDSTITATTGNIPIAPGSVEVLTFDRPGGTTGELYIAAIAAGTTGLISFTSGGGV
jgi:hypothetical protein